MWGGYLKQKGEYVQGCDRIQYDEKQFGIVRMQGEGKSGRDGSWIGIGFYLGYIFC